MSMRALALVVASASVLISDVLGAPLRVPVVLPANPVDHAGAVFVDVPTAEGVRTLALTPTSVRAAGARLRVERQGAERFEPWPESRTYAGTIVGVPGSRVAASIIPRSLRQGELVGASRTDEMTLHAVIELPGELARPGAGEGAHRVLFVQPASELTPGAFQHGVIDLVAGEAGVGPKNPHVVYEAADLAPVPAQCGGAADVPLARKAGAIATPSSPAPAGPQCLEQAQIAFDVDLPYYQRFNSVPAVVADLENVMNATNLIFARDTGIVHTTTEIIVRTSTDPYTTTSPGGLLEQFAQYWQANYPNIPRDATHLMTGRELDGNVIGVAYLNAVCYYGYGLSQTLYTNTLSFRVGLTAHELGHNWGANHCDGDRDCFIMCSGIGGCSGNVGRFGTRSITDARSFRDSVPCLDAAGPFSTPVPPRAVDDVFAAVSGEATRLDVIRNDADANCELVSILSIPATSVNGGTLTRSVGTGPGGRDEILYQSRTGFLGSDVFSYVLRDPGGLTWTARVDVNVLEARTPDEPGLTLQGLNAAYYHIGPITVNDVTRGRAIEERTLPAIAFPPSEGPVAGGTRSDGVGIVFTGTINVPTAGNYTFFVESDDGSALYVNNVLVAGNDGYQGMTERGGWMTLPAGPAAIRVLYFEAGGPAGVFVRIEGPGMPKQVIPESMWAPPGVLARFYAFDPVTTMPLYDGLLPASVGVVRDLNQANFDNFFAGSARRTEVAARFTGYFNAPADGLYQFFTASDDGSQLFIGDRLVVDNQGLHGTVERSGFAALRAGLHAIRIDFFQGGGPGSLTALVEGPALNKQVIPAALFRRATPDCNANGIPDSDEGTLARDLGDISQGGDGSGSAVTGAGLDALTGVRVPVSSFGSSRDFGPASYAALDGQAGRPNIPMVEGVFVPNGQTQIADSVSFDFGPQNGGVFDAIRNAGSLFEGPITPIVLPDAPGVIRRGLGMHSSAGITFDLDAVRAQNLQFQPREVEATIGLNRDGCTDREVHAEVFVLVDGQVRHRSFLSYEAASQQVRVNLRPRDRTLSFAVLDARTMFCDHVVLADARLILSTPEDRNLDGVLDECQCLGDFNRDDQVDLFDYLDFVSAFAGDDPLADFDGSGQVDFFDYLEFAEAFARGC
ncbi:MAG: PA14 domain-containing protein [Planctomycetota bacterium]|nr:PA14 domain-containing protein [Planctomycetota bacterium]